MSPATVVHVGIVTYDNASTIVDCIRSVHASVGAFDLRVKVLDNGSSDGTPDRIRSAFPSIETVDSRTNIGFGAGQNRLLSGSDAAYALMLNPDTVLRPDCISLLIDALRENPVWSAVGPRVDYPDGSPQRSFGPFPGLLADLGQRRRVHAARRRSPAGIRALERRLRHAFAPDWISGACLLIETSAFNAVGGFDEGYHLYLEDVDLCRRLRDLGHPVGVEPRARCVHHEGGSDLADDERRLVFRQSRHRYEIRHGRRWVAMLYRLARGL